MGKSKWGKGAFIVALALCSILALGQQAQSAELVLNDQNIDNQVTGIDVGRVSQAYNGLWCSLPPSFDLNFDQNVSGVDVGFSSQNYNKLKNLFDWGASPQQPPITLSESISSATFCSTPGQIITLMVDYDILINPTAAAIAYCSPASEPFSVNGMEVGFDIVNPQGSYFGAPGVTTTDAAVVVGVPESSGIAEVDLTCGSLTAPMTVIASVDLIGPDNTTIPFTRVHVTTFSVTLTIQGGGGCSISSVAPATGCPDDDVTITGLAFGPNTGTVSFDATPANIISWNDTSIVVDAPGGVFSNVTVTPPVGPPCSLPGAYNYDDVPPPAPVISSPVQDECINSTEVPTSITCAEGDCYEQIDGTGWQVCNTGFTVALGTFTHTIDARCVDACSNESSDSVNFSTDTEPPAIQINSPADGSTVCSSTVTTSVSCDGVTCEEQLDGISGWQFCGTGFPGVSHGPHFIDARCIDDCGNTSVDSNNFAVDVQAPAAPIVTPADGEYCSSQVISVTTIEGGPEHCTTDGSAPDCTDGPAPATVGTGMTLTCIECDACLNLGAPTARVYTEDTVANVAITNPPDGGTVVEGDVTVNGTADTDIPSVTVITSQGLTGEPYSSPVDGGGNWSVVLLGVIPPQITIDAQGTDDCGNIGSDSATVNVIPSACTISSVGPTTGCPGVDVTIDGTNFGPNTGTVAFDATPANIISWNDTTIVVDAPGGNYGNLTVTRALGGSCNYADTYSYDNVGPAAPIVTPADGEYCSTEQIVVTTDEGGPEHCTTDGSAPDCTDGPAPAFVFNGQLRCIECDTCGNLGAETVRNYTVDSTGPAAPIVTPADGEYCSTEQIVVTTDESGPEHCTTDGSAPDCTDPVAPAFVFNGQLRCIECDVCGNLGAETVRNYTVDVTGPLAPAVAPPDGEYCVGTSITVSTDEGGPEHCTTDGSAPDCASPAAPAVVFNGQLRCIECDVCGNEGAETVRNYTVDTQDPSVAITDPSNGAVICSTTVVVSGVAADTGSGVKVVRVNGFTATGTTNWTIIFYGQAGAPTYSAESEDNCGNLSTLDVVNVTIDVTGPVAPTIDPVSGEYCVDDPITVTANEPGGSLHCTIDASVPDCTSPAPPLTIPSGGFTLRCIQCDACSNVGAEASEVYTTDEGANVAITYPVDGETIGAGDVTVNGTADSDIPFVTVTSDQGHGPLTGVGTNWSVLLTGVTTPQITITAQGTDDCGNFTSTSVTVAVTIAPATPDAIAISAPTQAACGTDIIITLTSGGVGVPGLASDITCTGGAAGAGEVTYDCDGPTTQRTSGGTAVALGENPPDETAADCYDDDPNTKWLDFGGAGGYSWIYYQYGGAESYKIAGYELTSADDAPERDPMDWNFQGSNDGSLWTTLDVQAGIQFTARLQTLSFDVPSTMVASYSYYRLEITDIWDPGTANAVQLAEIEMYECEEIQGQVSYDPVPGGTCDFADGGALQTICGANWNSTGASELDTACGEINFGTDQGCYGPSGASYHMEDTDASTLVIDLDTSGMSNIKLDYCRATDGVDGGDEGLWVDWNDGTGWTCIEDHHCDTCGTGDGVGNDGYPNSLECGDGGGQTEWANTGCGQLSLPAGADDNPNLQVRFRCETSGFTDDCFVDEISVTHRVITPGGGGGAPVSFDPLPPNDIGGGDYQTNASVTSEGPATIICTYTGAGGPLSYVHVINFVTPTVSNIEPLPWDVLGPADDLDGNPGNGLQFEVIAATDAPDGTVAAILVDGVTEATPTVSGGSFSATITMLAGTRVIMENVAASCGSGSVTKTVTVDLTLYAVIVSDPSSVRIDTITVGTGGNFDIMVYGAVLESGVISTTSMGIYDFDIRHDVAGAGSMTLNSIAGSGVANGFNHIDGQSIDNTDDGDGFATSWFWAFNNGDGSVPNGIDIPLAVLNFTAGGTAGTTTIYISVVNDYQSWAFDPLETAPLRTLTVIIQ